MQDPKYEAWSKFISDGSDRYADYHAESLFIVHVIYIAWACSVFFNLVIMLNFLIASISETYDRYVQNKEAVRYYQRQGMVQEIKEIGRFFSIGRNSRMGEQPIYII